MGSTVPGGESAANIDGERSSHLSMRVTARPPAPADGGPASHLDVYAALTAAMCTGCVPPPRVTLRVCGDRRTAELEFPQSYPGARSAVDSWAAEFEAAPRVEPEILAVRYGFEPHDCRRAFAAGWGLRVVAHLDLPPTLGGVDRVAGAWRENQPHSVDEPLGVVGSHTTGGCPVDGGAPTTSSPVGLEGARPGPDSGAILQGAAVGGGHTTDRTVVVLSRRGATAAAHNPQVGDAS